MIKKCLFPIAGCVIRFYLPPKQCLKKYFQYSLNLYCNRVSKALTAGISNMAIVTFRGKRAIEDYFHCTAQQMKN